MTLTRKVLPSLKSILRVTVPPDVTVTLSTTDSCAYGLLVAATTRYVPASATASRASAAAVKAFTGAPYWYRVA